VILEAQALVALGQVNAAVRRGREAAETLEEMRAVLTMLGDSGLARTAEDLVPLQITCSGDRHRRKSDAANRVAAVAL